MNKLDFGSGYNPKIGYSSCDIYGYVDYYFDIKGYIILSCKDEIFEEINCRNVIHHIKDLDKISSEFYRVMKKDSLLIITEPRKEFYYENYYLDYLWYRYVIPRYEVWFSPFYRNYENVFSKKFTYIRTIIENEKEIKIFKKI